MKKRKKKKVKQNDKLQETKNEPKVEEDDGFETVNKSKKHKPRNEEEEVREEKPYKKDNFDKTSHKRVEGENKFQNPHKRVLDKQSGTGYTKKDVKKGGFASKGGWQGHDEDNTDYLFEKALNPKPKYDVTQEKIVDTKIEAPKQEEIPKEETKNEDKSQDDNDTKKKKKKGETEEEPAKDLLKIPENAMTLEEFKKQKKVSTQVNVTEKKSRYK